ncbi:MAG: hypothetical protein HQL52_13570 [Magnetococcales bacterium]|nr:hypothetical protein [Magnetococcales bacterium]
MFTGVGLDDLTKILILAATTDTLRPIYQGIIRLQILEFLLNAIEAGQEIIDLGEFGVWHLAKMGKASGYLIKLQNKSRGLVLLFRSYYTTVDKKGSHLKIEVSPHAIRQQSVDDLQNSLDKIADWLLKEAEPAGVAVHLAVDVQNWIFPKDFQDRFVTHASVQRRHDGIIKAKFETLSKVAVTYGNTETITFGKPNALQVCVYRKDLALIKDDKVDEFHALWKEEAGDKFDPKSPVWRVELRFHQRVIKDIGRGLGKPLLTWKQVFRHLTDIWRYGLRRNRLDQNSVYIDPFWQLLMEDVAFLTPATGVTIRRKRKADVTAIDHNLSMVVGNLITIFARQGLKASKAVAHFKKAGFYEELLISYRSKGLTEGDLYQKVEKGLALRRMIGKAA